MAVVTSLKLAWISSACLYSGSWEREIIHSTIAFLDEVFKTCYDVMYVGEGFGSLSLTFFFSKFTTTAICRALFMTGLIDLPYSKPSRLSQWLVLPCYSEPEWVKGTELEPVVKYVGVCTLKRSADKECWTPKAVSGHFDAGDSLSWDFSSKRYHFSSLWSPPRRSGHRRRAFSSCHFSEMKNLQAEFQQVWNRHKGTAVT